MTSFYFFPPAIRPSLNNLEKEVTALSIPEISAKVIENTELSSQSFSKASIPEIKKIILSKHPEAASLLEKEETWNEFYTKNADALKNIDNKALKHLASSLYTLKKKDLLEYLNLKQSPEVKSIQEKISTYMLSQFQQDSAKILNQFQKLAEDFYYSEKEIQTFSQTKEEIEDPALINQALETKIKGEDNVKK